MQVLTPCLLCLLACLLLSPGGQAEYYETVSRLHKDLLGSAAEYNKSVRPQEKVILYFTMVLKFLREMNIEAQTMTMKEAVSLTWFDPRLRWDPPQHGNVTVIHVDPQDVWKPPFYVGNAVTSEGVLDSNVPMQVQSNGYISWTLDLTTVTDCIVSTKLYPFDVQYCTIDFQIFSTTDIMDLVLPEMASFDGFLLENGEWDIVMAEPSKIVVEWKDIGQSYPAIVYQFALERKRPYYVTAILVPVLLLSVLIVAVFWVPIESGEKMGYCLTILLTYTLFLSIVSNELPPIATDVSYLQVYLAVSMAIGVVVTLLTLFVQNLYHRGDAEPSDWLKSLTNNFLLPITCRKRCCCAGKGKKEEEGGRCHGNGAAGISMAAHTNMDHGFLRHVGEEKMTHQDVARAFDRFFLLTFSLVMLLVTAAFTALLFLHVPQAPPALSSFSV